MIFLNWKYKILVRKLYNLNKNDEDFAALKNFRILKGCFLKWIYWILLAF